MTTPGALVVGGDYRGLGLVRSLGRHGIPVWVTHGADTVAVRSRYCRRAVRLPDDRAATAGFLADLSRANGLAGWVLFPTSDESAAVISHAADELASCYRLTTPPWEAYRRAADKRCALAAAVRSDVPVPRTWLPRDATQLRELDLPYPVVLKPTIRLAINDLTYDKAWRADSAASLLEQYHRATSLLDPGELIVQELIPGDGTCQLSFGAVCRAGRPVVSATVCRARQFPTDFGRASTAVVTIDRDDVAQSAARLLRELGVNGLVEVEFKLDPRDGQPKLLDVNLRVWGWHSIGAAAGVDFAYAAYLVALERAVPEAVGEVGIRWARLAIDVPVSMREIAARRLQPRPYLRSLRRPLAGPIAARDDPWPAVMDPLLLTRAAIGRTLLGR